MPKQAINLNSYPNLLSQLKAVFIEGMQRIEEEKVRTYWRTGQLISQYLLENKQRADYGKNIFERLGSDLGVHHKTLERTVRFYRAFPIPTALSKLSWLHQLQLISITDKEKRNLFAQRAIKKQWGYRELSDAIRLDRLKIEDPQEKIAQVGAESGLKPLSTTRSRLFTYQILEPSYIHPIEERLVIDLGFTFIIQAEAKGIKLKAGEIIESVKNKEDYALKHSDAKPKELYTYKALVEKVIDADTIWLNIDLGFDSWTRQKVRLQGIDAPELSTQEGQQAKTFVEARLKEVDFVVIKTYKSDKYDRYLADIFYQAQENDTQKVLEQGQYLNQELLDNNLAAIYSV